MNKTANRIEERREELGLSRRTLGELIGSSETQIWRYETAKNDPTASVLLSLANALKTSPDWLMGFTDVQPDRLDDTEREALAILRSKAVTRRAAIIEIMRLAQ
jgi:transcriptional regulator with XRE-family HTH domain